MAEKRRFLDVWIVESNTVYKEVPYTVVVDWVQQGRLLEEDNIKASGTKDWKRIGDSSDVAAFLPRQDPLTAEDQAEALEPVSLDFAWKKHHEEEDDDVDMIPLIDVSLVLLIFFMLTASSVGSTSFVDTPATEWGQTVDNPDALRIDINREADGSAVYALGTGDKPADKEDADLRTPKEVLDRLAARLARVTGQVEVVINAHKDLPARYARQLLVDLREEPFRGKISVNFFGVSEKTQ